MTKDETQGCWLILFLTFLVPFGWALRGWVLFVLWGWFVLPLGAPAVTIPQALGLSVLSTLFLPNTSHRQDKDERDTLTIVIDVTGRTLGAPLGSLLAGWVLLVVSS